MGALTQILADIRGGKIAAGELVPIVYDELKSIAAQQLSREKPGHTLQVTALVNEAYLRLFTTDDDPTWQNRAHFFGAAAEAMRRILVDYARRRGSLKRGGRRDRVPLQDEHPSHDVPIAELLDVHDLLEKLAEHDPAKADVVKLRYFAGLTMDEVARVLGISLPTANRYWAYARAWMFQELSGESTHCQVD